MRQRGLLTVFYIKGKEEEEGWEDGREEKVLYIKKKRSEQRKKLLTNQCLTRHFDLHSGRWRKAMRGRGEGGGHLSKRERGKSQRKPIKAACISLIFTIAMTFTSCRSRPGKRVNKWGRSEAPGLPHHAAAHIPNS